MKNGCKSAEKAKPEHYTVCCCCFFNASNAKTKLYQQEGVTTRGSGAEPPASGGQWGFEGGAHDAAAILQLFIQKIPIFRHMLAYIFA